ncbi:MAG: phytanoyl-CoA dioxygenase family protein [Ginsengibacter sp.]
MMQIIKRSKTAYSMYNFFHKKELIHNEISFRKWGIKKKYYSSISSKDFKNISLANFPDTPKEPDFSSCKLFKELDADSKKSIVSFHENGFAKINNYLPDMQVAEVNKEIDQLINNRTVKFNSRNKIMFAIHHSTLIKNIAEDKNLKELLGKLINGVPILFQSINFLMGSEQHTHSDSIHMTTFPLGGLLGAWIALEDITTENGPLHYYPKSHTLPYYLNSDYDNEGSGLFIGNKSYKDYEKMIGEKIQQQGLKKEILFAKKGDLFIWHANLFHGGETHINKNLTRRSMVFHYFRKDSICYHEITQRPALIKNYS